MLGLSNRVSNHKKTPYSSDIALDFDGAYDYMYVPDHADFNHSNGSFSKFSVSFWFRAHDYTGTLSNDQVLIGRFDLNDKREWMIYMHTSRQIKIATCDDGTVGNNKTYETTFTVSDGNWHHCYFRYDGSKSTADHRVYAMIDGNMVLGYSSSGNTGTIPSNSYAELFEADQDLYIGALHTDGTAARFFDGRIDEVSYWDGHFYFNSSANAAKHIYNNGVPRDLTHVGSGNENAKHVLYLKAGDWYKHGCAAPTGTFPVSGTNPMDADKYQGSANAHIIACLNYAGSKPTRGPNLLNNGDVSTAITELTASDNDNGVSSNTDTWRVKIAGSDTGGTCINDTTLYRSNGRSIKMTCNEDNDWMAIMLNTNAQLENGAFYELDMWVYGHTDMSDASQGWATAQVELDECIESDAQYGKTGDGNIQGSQFKTGKWNRYTYIGRHNKGSDAVELFSVARSVGNLGTGAGTGPITWNYDDMKVHKLSGEHHAIIVSSANATSAEGVNQ